MDFLFSIGIKKMPKIPDKNNFDYFLSKNFLHFLSQRKKRKLTP